MEEEKFKAKKSQQISEEDKKWCSSSDVSAKRRSIQNEDGVQ